MAESRSDETFVALCLLTVTGASLLTQKLGFSDTAGAFAAGVLLSETNFRSQVGGADTSASCDLCTLHVFCMTLLSNAVLSHMMGSCFPL